MTTRQLRRYEMLVRVAAFGAARRDRFPAATRAGKAFAAVADAVVQLRDGAVAQLAARGGARAVPMAKAALMTMLESIARTARVIEADEPGFPDVFHLPGSESAHAVLTAARLFAREIPPVVMALVEHGMPETVVADLTCLLDAYAEAIRQREAGKGASAGRRAAIDVTLSSAAAAARRLDVIVFNQMSGDPVTRAEWSWARRVSPTGSSSRAFPRGANRWAQAAVLQPMPAVVVPPEADAAPRSADRVEPHAWNARSPDVGRGAAEGFERFLQEILAGTVGDRCAPG